MLVVFVSLEYHTAYIPGGRLRRQAPSGGATNPNQALQTDAQARC